MDLLEALIVVSEKAANVARLCRKNLHLFSLLVQEKKSDEKNPRFLRDFKTLADVLIQEMVKHEIGLRFPELRASIHGEENNTFCNILGETICVEIKDQVAETAKLLETVLDGDAEAAQLLAGEVHREICLQDVDTEKPSEDASEGETENCFEVDLGDLGIWIDPIDSTAEYINGVESLSKIHPDVHVGGLRCVTVLIGVYKKSSGLPVIGVVNQPFYQQSQDSTWHGKCFWGIPGRPSVTFGDDIFFDSSANTRAKKIICVSGSENEAILQRLAAVGGFEVVEAAGAGYKLLSVITGPVSAYVLTKSSTFKWDTCGPQAILRSQGGDVIVCDDVMTQHAIESVKYSDVRENSCNGGGIIAFRDWSTLQEVLKCLVVDYGKE